MFFIARKRKSAGQGNYPDLEKSRRVIRKGTAVILSVLLFVVAFSGCRNVTTEPQSSNPGGSSLSEIAENSEEGSQTEALSEAGSEPVTAALDYNAMAEDILSKMTTEEKVEQMLMPCFRSKTDGEEKVGVTELDEARAKIIKDHSFGGIILFNQNLENADQGRAFIDSLQKANAEGGAKTKLLIGTDQEGGNVTRVTTGTQMPGSMALAATGNPDLTKECFKIMGEELKSIGINVDFAPVVDVNSNPANPVIGVRSFSDDPKTVSEFGKAGIEGLHEEGLIVSLKHFPGHGDVMTDSHTGLSCIEASLEELREFELVPFKELTKDADMIMTAHIQYPMIETEKYVSIQDGEEITLPATLSRRILTDLLRDEMGFEGVIVTDALDMDAIDTHFEKTDAVKLAINAGADLMLMPFPTYPDEELENVDSFVEDIVKMIESGEISREEIDDSVLRILCMKAKYGLLENQEATVTASGDAKNIVGSQNHHETEWDIATKAVTLLKNEGDALPLKDSEKVVVAIPYTSEENSVQYAVERAKAEGVWREDAEIEPFYYGEVTPETAADSARETIKEADTVIAISALYDRAALNPGGEKPNEAVYLDELEKAVHKKGGKFILLSAQLPYDTARYQKADAIVVCYLASGMRELPGDFAPDLRQYGPNVPAAIFSILGGCKMQGKLPVDIPVIDEEYEYTDEVLYHRGDGLDL